jgi:hypothetical protein
MATPHTLPFRNAVAGQHAATDRPGRQTLQGEFIEAPREQAGNEKAAIF